LRHKARGATSSPTIDKASVGVRLRRPDTLPRRTARYSEEPAYYEPAGLWLYGNVRLLDASKACIGEAHGPRCHRPADLERIEEEATNLVLGGKILVCGVHNPAHQRAAVVPLRWGSPRIVVFSGGFRWHLGEKLDEEAFLTARLWRQAWDPETDLAVSRRAPDRLPTFALHNPTVDRLIVGLSDGSWPGFRSNRDPLGPVDRPR